MRRQLIAGNWKMNLDKAGSVKLAQDLAVLTADVAGCDIAVVPPFVYVDAVAQALAGSKVVWGIQDCYFESNGAYTGEISVAMAKDLGCTYVILGHSERRHIIGETDALINKKTLAVLAGGMLPIVCVGETKEERESNRTMEVIGRQMAGSLAGLTAEQMKKTVIAYEPVWAIGTGLTASPAQAEEVHAAIRAIIAKTWDAETAGAVVIQYGGSVKSNNAKELLALPNVDGALVGGAALKADSFKGIIDGAQMQ
ncbi:MAG: triose-phosphate isomerase [Thermoguttaceae bacterium]|nr:triose-phosphate isomerase [Thermoguttaceae bacterium]